MIQRFINDVCDILHIETPIISYDTSHFQSMTMYAQANPNKNVIYLRKDVMTNKPNPDLFFAIAHELRHLWQYQTDELLYLSDYKTSDQCESLDEYNLQLAELDANAFGGLIMIEFFHVKPLFNNLSTTTKKLVFQNIETLSISLRDKT